MSLDIDESRALRRTTVTGSPAESLTVRQFFQTLCPDNDQKELCNQLSATEKTIVSRYAFALGTPLPQRGDILRSLESFSNRRAVFESIKKSLSWQDFNDTLVSPTFNTSCYKY